jgi:hypothetical protein
MKRFAFIAVGVLIVGGILWSVVASLEDEPSGRDEPPAVIMRAPDGFDVVDFGPAVFENVVAALRENQSERIGIEFVDDGDTVILLVDRAAQRVIEMRASRTGTIVERTWSGETDRRLGWAADNGNLDAPGLPPATGKNLYH